MEEVCTVVRGLRGKINIQNWKADLINRFCVSFIKILTYCQKELKCWQAFHVNQSYIKCKTSILQVYVYVKFPENTQMEYR